MYAVYLQGLSGAQRELRACPDTQGFAELLLPLGSVQAHVGADSLTPVSREARWAQRSRQAENDMSLSIHTPATATWSRRGGSWEGRLPLWQEERAGSLS